MRKGAFYENTTTTALATTTVAPSSTVLSNNSSTTIAPSILPSAFDTGIGQNMTEASCTDFFQRFLSNNSFINCYPISFLLHTSESFFEVTKSGISTLTSAIDLACNADFQQCATLMTDYAGEMLSPETCLDDYMLQNPQVVNAYNGFMAYSMMYWASCLRSANGSYCFVDSMYGGPTTFRTSFLYFLPLGYTYPSAAGAPSCSKCTSSIMKIFNRFTGNKSYAITDTYKSASKVINEKCGAIFVPASLSSANTTYSTSSASSLRNRSGHKSFSLIYAFSPMLLIFIFMFAVS
ncbi:hypothetical protein V1511DRAFT_455396 [Dipodascopsis uninucleata]